MDAITRRLRDSLTAAIRERNADAVAALRSTLAAIANAEAVDAPDSATPVVGLGAGDVARKELSTADVVEIVRSEITDRLLASQQYETLGRIDEARRLRAEAATLERFL